MPSPSRMAPGGARPGPTCDRSSVAPREARKLCAPKPLGIACDPRRFAGVERSLDRHAFAQRLPAWPRAANGEERAAAVGRVVLARPEVDRLALGVEDRL